MTGKELYDLALQLLGFKNADGSENPDCMDLSSRAVSLTNILLAETLWLDRILKKDGEAVAEYLRTDRDEIACHSLLANGVLPYGLAALLVAEEDDRTYKIMYERYLLGIKELKEAAVGARHEIDDCYKYHG